MVRQHDRAIYDHPADVLGYLSDRQKAGGSCALVAVVDTVGGSVRAPGALIGVDAEGTMAGYVSNGCVDADIAAQARDAMEEGRARTIRYGKDSPYLDLRLPCGGAVELFVVPDPQSDVLAEALATLQNREAVDLVLSESGLALGAPGKAAARGHHIRCEPKLKLRIAGRGAEPIALARLGVGAGFDVVVQSPDRDCLAAARNLPGVQARRLSVPGDRPPADDDPWTAFVLMFHDHEWEEGLLEDALAGPAFYVGALGGRKTHANRRERLIKKGIAREQVERVRGPIGLVASLRSSGMVAVSTLAEIVQVFETRDMPFTEAETEAA